MPIFSAFISTLLLGGLAFILPLDDWFGTLSATMIAVAAVWSGWFYVATRRVAAGRVHGLIMAAIGCLGLYSGIATITDHSIAGGRGPDANPTAGIIYGIGLAAAAIGTIPLLCGLLVIWNTFNASRRNPNVA